MKLLIIFALAPTSAGAFANAKVFCKESGRIINVLSTDGLECQGALYTGAACFTGDVKVASKILNSQQVRDLFDGTDGEYVKNAKAKDADTITMIAVDEANGWSSKVSIKRCLGSWFRN